MTDDGASAWSGLGSTMSLPSTVRDEMERLRLEIRDIKLEVSRDIMELRGTVDEIVGQLAGVIGKHQSMLTRIEGLEIRAQTIAPVSTKDEFNAFAYVSLDELEDSLGVNEGVLEARVDVKQLEEQPNGAEVNEELPTDKSLDDEESSTEEIARNFVEQLRAHIAVNGSVHNNVMYSKVTGKKQKFAPEVKALIKQLIADDDYFESVKVDQFRSLIYAAENPPEDLEV